MKFALLLSALLIAVAVVHSAPHNSEDINESSGLRQKRSTVTCDFFGFTGDTVCTSTCFATGKKSGTCIGKTCVCKGESVIGDAIVSLKS